jgi:hypothetical protein
MQVSLMLSRNALLRDTMHHSAKQTSGRFAAQSFNRFNTPNKRRSRGTH